MEDKLALLTQTFRKCKIPGVGIVVTKTTTAYTNVTVSWGDVDEQIQLVNERGVRLVAQHRDHLGSNPVRGNLLWGATKFKGNWAVRAAHLIIVRTLWAKPLFDLARTIDPDVEVTLVGQSRDYRGVSITFPEAYKCGLANLNLPKKLCLPTKDNLARCLLPVAHESVTDTIAHIRRKATQATLLARLVSKLLRDQGYNATTEGEFGYLVMVRRITVSPYILWYPGDIDGDKNEEDIPHIRLSPAPGGMLIDAEGLAELNKLNTILRQATEKARQDLEKRNFLVTRPAPSLSSSIELL